VTPTLEWKKHSGEEVEIRYSERALVQNGGFSVYKGEIVVPEGSEPGRFPAAYLSMLMVKLAWGHRHREVLQM
jgi:hypothetical protein